MTNSFRKRFALLVVICAALAPLGAHADGMNAQEKEMLSLATDLSRRCAATLERWIVNKEVTEERLFSSFYYPVPKTDPPKYTTDWDRLSDRDILPIEESVLTKSAAIVFAVLTDKNGYVPTHNQRFSQPLTGNRAVNLINNRTKTMFINQTGLAASRSQAAFLFQRYQRDTGEALMDVSVPVFVRGVHWGAVRVGYRPIDPS